MKLLNAVKRSVYTSLRQGELGDYVDMLLDHAQGPEFEPFQTILSDLGKKNTDFQTALSKVKDGGKPATTAKDKAKKLLIAQINLYANAIDSAAITNPDIIPLSGFINKTSNTTRPPYEKMPPPNAVEVTPNLKVSGQALLEIIVKNAKKTWTYTSEWTSDGETWTRIKISTSKKYVVDGLPSDTKVKIRVMINGTNGYSDYTESAYVHIV